MFIAFSGLDGCGKGSQIEFLSRYLESKGQSVYISKAYGQPEKELFSQYVETMDQVSLLFLFQALHSEQYIRTKKALDDGKVVLADRWDDSYLAYHSRFGVLSDDESLRNRLNQLAFNDLKPDFTVYLKVSVEVSMKRTLARGADFFDKKGFEYHSAMKEQYEKLLLQENWVSVDGEQSAQKIHNEILSLPGLSNFS